MKDIKTDSINELLDHYAGELGVDKGKAEIKVLFSNAINEDMPNCTVAWDWDEEKEQWIPIVECT